MRAAWLSSDHHHLDNDCRSRPPPHSPPPVSPPRPPHPLPPPSSSRSLRGFKLVSRGPQGRGTASGGTLLPVRSAYIQLRVHGALIPTPTPLKPAHPSLPDLRRAQYHILNRLSSAPGRCFCPCFLSRPTRPTDARILLSPLRELSTSLSARARGSISGSTPLGTTNEARSFQVQPAATIAPASRQHQTGRIYLLVAGLRLGKGEQRDALSTRRRTRGATGLRCCVYAGGGEGREGLGARKRRGWGLRRDAAPKSAPT
ncbi:hypothetical protein MKEN_01491600 [Mycena kentingensis (nom. inval.)]|nr:hypothetical protein MKEN_01491600 [Mycena kentingensis (nom. inval.)]